VSALFRAARGYIERLGLRLVVADGEKVPLVHHGFPNGASSATTDLARIDRALASRRDPTLAARVGRHVVLDVDPRHGGHESLAKHLAYFGALPPTWQARTPSGGSHFWFRGVDFETKNLAKGVEVLRGNRLVTLPPSQRASGVYRWEQHPLDVPLAEAPRWLLDAVRAPELPQRVPHRADDASQREKRARAYLAKVDPAVSGQHGHARTFFAAQLVVRGFDLEPDVALGLLHEWNRDCVPPWSERDLRHKVKEAVRRGRMPWGAMLNEGSAV